MMKCLVGDFDTTLSTNSPGENTTMKLNVSQQYTIYYNMSLCQHSRGKVTIKKDE